MNEMERKGYLIKKYILSLVYEDEVPEIVNSAIDELVQAAQQSVQRTALPCGHDANNLRMGVNGYGCAECESSRR